jgi:hypothetical protein
MDTIDIGPLKAVKLKAPRGSIIIGLQQTYIESRLRAMPLSYTITAALGIACDSPHLGLPTYYSAQDPIPYGMKIQDRLLSLNVGPGAIHRAGDAVIAWLFTLLPTELEVEEAEDFTPPQPAA